MNTNTWHTRRYLSDCPTMSIAVQIGTKPAPETFFFEDQPPPFRWSQSGSTSLPAFKTMFLPTNILRLSDLVPRQKSTLWTQPLSTRLLGNAYTFVMEPLERTVVVVTTHHIPKGDLLTDTVYGRIFALFIFHIHSASDQRRGEF